MGEDTFVKLLASARDPQDALDRIEGKYELGYHKAAKMAEISRWARIWAVTSIDADIMRSIFIKPYRSIQKALDDAVAVMGREKILFMMAASMTVPRLRERLVMRPRRFIYGSRSERDTFTRPEKVPIDAGIMESLMENR